jgi:hypothetical protein
MRPPKRHSPAQPWNVLGALALAQWLLLLLLTDRVVHNRWLFPQVGTPTSFYSGAWSLAHGHIPPALDGYGWPLLVTSIAGIVGADFLDALPALVLLQTLVLMPLALAALYGFASRIAGRTFGYFAAACWVVFPYVAHPLFAPGYRPTYLQQLLPQGLGLTAADDFPGMVCVLVAAYLALTSVDTADRVHAGLAGLVTGFAIAFNPANALFLAAPFIAYALARRWSTALAFALAVLPALATITLWQYRALGHVPHISVPLDPDRLRALRLDFRDVFYSDRLVEIGFIAGVIGVARRSWVKSAFVGAWFLPYVLVRGSSTATSIGTGTWFPAFMPAFPAFVIACCSLLLLVPRRGHRLANTPAAGRFPSLEWRDRRVVATAILLAAFPLVVVGALPVQESRIFVVSPGDGALVPVDKAFQPRGGGRPQAASLTWPARTPDGAASFYVVFRSPANGSEGLVCHRHGATVCTLAMRRLGTATDVYYSDASPAVPSGRWTYRIGVAANADADPNAGGLTVLSPPVVVTVP